MLRGSLRLQPSHDFFDFDGVATADCVHIWRVFPNAFFNSSIKKLLDSRIPLVSNIAAGRHIGVRIQQPHVVYKVGASQLQFMLVINLKRMELSRAVPVRAKTSLLDTVFSSHDISILGLQLKEIVILSSSLFKRRTFFVHNLLA